MRCPAPPLAGGPAPACYAAPAGGAFCGPGAGAGWPAGRAEEGPPASAWQFLAAAPGGRTTRVTVRAFPPRAFAVRALGAAGGLGSEAPTPGELRTAAPLALALDGAALSAGADGPPASAEKGGGGGGSEGAAAATGAPGSLAFTLGGCGAPRAAHVLVEETAAAASGAAWGGLSDADLKLGAWCWNVTAAAFPSDPGAPPPPPPAAYAAPPAVPAGPLDPRDPCTRCLELYVETEALPECTAPPPPVGVHRNPPPPPPAAGAAAAPRCAPRPARGPLRPLPHRRRRAGGRRGLPLRGHGARGAGRQ